LHRCDIVTVEPMLRFGMGETIDGFVMRYPAIGPQDTSELRKGA